MSKGTIISTSLHQSPVLFLVVGLLLFLAVDAQAQNITPASGGENISADSVNGNFTTLGNIIIDETSTGQISQGQLNFNVPEGFEWDTTASYSVSITSATGFPGNGTKLDIAFSSVTSTEVTFNVISTSDKKSNKPGKATFSGFAVRPTTATLPNKGQISASGAALFTVDANFGDLKMVAGSPANIFVETAADGSGTQVPKQNLTAGNSLTVYAISKDQGGNFIDNVAANAWNMTNKSGLTANPLTVAGDSKSATFSSTTTGSADISVSKSGLTSHSTGTITVVPDDPTALVIQTQPSSPDTAGTAFTTQPVLHINDQYGNTVTSNSYSNVTAKREAGTGTLEGTTTVPANSGIVTFTDLYHTKANDISIKFSASGLTSATSNTITVKPAAADSLTFKVQPPNGAKNTALSPAPEVRLLDTYGNKVAAQDTTVSLTKVSGSGNINGTPSVLTNTNGTAVFNDIKLTKNDTYVFKATSNGLKDSENSDSFTIASAGSLAGFKVAKSGGGTIGSQVAGEPFNIGIVAIDGVGDTLDGNQGRDNFTGYVDLTTKNKFSDDIDTTQIGPFSSGVYDPSPQYSVKLIHRGSDVTITATNAASGSNESGTSNAFAVTANNAFADSTIMTVNQDTLTANGTDTTLITIQLQDSLGNNLATGGDNVAISKAGTGTLSSTTDNGDGTYSAILTAPADTGSATISVDVNSATATNVTKTIHFVPGPLATFRIEDAGGNTGTVSDQRAGTPFDVKITAKDADSNTVTSFNGTVEISSGATFSSGDGTTALFTNGVLPSHSVTITSAGDYRLKARRTGHSETGTSNQFTVSPAAADGIGSTISSFSPYLENIGSDTTTVSIQLKDAYGNNLTSQNGYSVLVKFVGSPSATLNNNGSTTYEGNGTYTDILTASSTIETVNITASFTDASNNTADIKDTAQVVITRFNTWQSKSNGKRAKKQDWGTSGNWSLSVPTTNQVTRIPTHPKNNDPAKPIYPRISQNSTIDFMDVKSQATVNLEQGYTMNINRDLSGDGTYICDRSDVYISGNLTIATFASSTCNITLTGSGTAQISGVALAGNLTIDKDVTLTGTLQTIDTLTVTSGHTLTVQDGANLDLQGTSQIDGQIDLNGGHLTIGDNVTNGSNLNISDTNVEFNGTTHQDITGLDSFSNLKINNSDGVTFHNDVVVNDTLKLTSGILTLDSGVSLVTTNKTGNLSNIRMYRIINDSTGWRMLSSPLASTYTDLLDSTVTQGFTNAQYPSDTLQPNVLYYDETYNNTGTSSDTLNMDTSTNQKWRVPSDAANDLTAGRGLFVYFFDNIPSDSRYNNPLPDTLVVQGAENGSGTDSFTFPVTYTADAVNLEMNAGWNLIGNPYAAAIDWDDGNWTKKNMDNVFYVWDPRTKQYYDYNGIAGDDSLKSGLIKPFQAFWVKANGNGVPSLTVNETSKTTGGTFYGKSKREPAAIGFKLEAGGLSKTSYLTLSPNGKNTKDSRDAYRLLPFDTDTYLDLYFTLENGSQLDIDNLARAFGKKISIPIYVGGFKNGKPINGNYTLSWPEFGKVPDAWNMVLEDTKTGDKIDLRKNPFYSFDVNQSKQKKPVNNTPRNFHLVEVPSQTKAKSKAKDKARFILHIDPGADAAGLPDKYSLGINYPNPFDDYTKIKYATPVEGKVQLMIYDILGRRVKTIVNEREKADFHEIKWTPSRLASGVYICVMRAGGKQFTRKITYIK